MRRRVSALHVFVAAVFLGAMSVVAATLVDSTWPRWGSGALQVTLVLALGVLLGEWLSARIWRDDGVRGYTFSGTFAIALIIAGPLWIPVSVQGVALIVDDVRHRRSLVKILFNLGQYVLAAGAARWVYASLTAQPFGGYAERFTAEQVLPALVAAAVYFVVNVLLVSTVLAMVSGASVVSSLAADIRSEFSMTTLLLCMAPVVLLSLQFSLLMAPLCVLPIVAVHQAAQAAASSGFQARHDALTGLPNRRLLLHRIDKGGESNRQGEQTALLLLDLDHFKEINDTLGHHVGDQLLQLVAARLRSVVRDSDTVARLGGDEFAVVCPGLKDADAAVLLSDRCREALGEPFVLEQISLHVEASVGIALMPLHADGADQLMQQADVALYQAKADRGTTRTYDPKHDSNSMERLALMEHLRSAMDSELVVHYQPKCRASDGAILGVEALVRWQHPRYGLLQPSRFLAAAENAGLIVPMTMIILEESLRQVRQWREAGLELHVAVNISPRHLTDTGLPARIAGLLGAHQLPGEALTLEVTESSIMSDPARAAHVLRKIRELGVAVSIDDFGTGYSSLAYLRDLHATEVKIDKTFVQSAASNERDKAIVRAAVELGHTLGLQVVAEGIEDVETARLMAASGCDVLQGYLIHSPAPADRITAWAGAREPWMVAPAWCGTGLAGARA